MICICIRKGFPKQINMMHINIMYYITISTLFSRCKIIEERKTFDLIITDIKLQDIVLNSKLLNEVFFQLIICGRIVTSQFKTKKYICHFIQIIRIFSLYLKL